MASEKRIRLKCHFQEEIRLCLISESSQISEFVNFQNMLFDLGLSFACSLKERLFQDFGFHVSLKYKDEEGDQICLATQNDLQDLIASSPSGGVVNVDIKETMFPEPCRKSSQSSFRPLSMSISSSQQPLTPLSYIQRSGRFDKFPSLDTAQTPFQRSRPIRFSLPSLPFPPSHYYFD